MLPSCSLAIVLVLLLDQATASVPIYLQPFINYYEVYLDPYDTVRLDGPQGYIATLVMLYLVVMGTLGYLPLNLKDIANIIDSKRSRKSGGYKRNRLLQRRRGYYPRRKFRGKRALSDPAQLQELLSELDPENCLLHLICEAEYLGPHQAATVEHRLVHKLFSADGDGTRIAPLEHWAKLGRKARGLNYQRSPCGQLRPQCQSESTAGSRDRDRSATSAEIERHRSRLEKLSSLLTSQTVDVAAKSSGKHLNSE